MRTPAVTVSVGSVSGVGEHCVSCYDAKVAAGMNGLAQDLVVMGDDLLRRQAGMALNARCVSVSYQQVLVAQM